MPRTPSERAIDRAVFLDRDGVINRSMVKDGKPYPPATMEELEILPGVEEALHDLRAAGFRLIVVTNQPDVATGKTPRAFVDQVNNYLMKILPLDDIKTCFHSDQDHCNCRKPKPGLLLEAARQYGIDLKTSYMVGDRWRDTGAGEAAGCKVIWIENDYKEKKPNHFDFKAPTLSAAARWILAQ